MEIGRPVYGYIPLGAVYEKDRIKNEDIEEDNRMVADSAWSDRGCLGLASSLWL
jgi:hypothetical protein